MTREDVLWWKEFGSSEQMADEIVRLREIVERTEWEREQAWQVTQQQKRILAALREPWGILDSVVETLGTRYLLSDAIRAAVAAAEKEAA